jgi:RNA polymerase sigma factor (sigma-70 family)
VPPPAPDPAPTRFATTRWTLVHEAARGGDTVAVAALGALFQTYRPPLYRYARRLGHPAADAEDLVQGFFAHLLRLDGLRLADPDRGRFRAFLLGGLKHHLANQWRHEHRLKRGGHAPRFSLDWRHAETGLGLDPADSAAGPDELFDREWALALLDKVLADLAAEATDLDFERWKPFLGIGSERLPYAAIAAEFDLTEGAARVAVHRLRQRYRQRLRAEIARTLSDPRLVEDELRALFAALGG